MSEYFKLIRTTLALDRKKYKKTDSRYVYYEGHHIIPKSFPGKKSKLVNLTPEEHYRCHYYLMMAFRDHTLYGLKMTFAFKCMTSINKMTNVELSEIEYGVARKNLSEKYKGDILQKAILSSVNKRKGKRIVCKNSKLEYICKDDVCTYLENGWLLTNGTKGTSYKGKVTSKGIIVCEYIDGYTIEAPTGYFMANVLNESQANISYHLTNNYNTYINNRKFYYKDVEYEPVYNQNKDTELIKKLRLAFLEKYPEKIIVCECINGDVYKCANVNELSKIISMKSATIFMRLHRSPVMANGYKIYNETL